MIALETDDALLARFVRDLHTGAGTAMPVPAGPITAGTAADREAARLAWAHRIVDEYRSLAVFGELLVLCAELEAPYPVLCAIQHLIGDELRHARTCAEVVRWLGGADDLAIDLSALGLPPRAADESRGRRAALIVARELVVAEEESIVMLAACRDATTEPSCRAVLAAVLRDEVRHAACGRALLHVFEHGALAHAITDADRADVRAVMATDRNELRAIYRAAATGGPGRAFGASITGDEVEALGAAAWTSCSDRGSVIHQDADPSPCAALPVLELAP